MRKFIAICLGISLFGLLTPPLASAQNGKYTVQGTVVDATGLPVIGATIVEKGTVNGVSTDFNGEYSLSVSNENAVVEVSYIGCKTVELVASSELLKNLTLEEDLMSLDEVVVIGYGAVKKNDMTGSVVAIKAEEMNRGAVNSPDQLLLGKVPGLLVTPADGAPGGRASIRIRGAASLNANNDPLIVIDGVPVTSEANAGMGNPLGSVNPNDIESYTVLKDASATAIYGSRASNGVIIITTKKGKGKKVSVSYDSSYAVKNNADRIEVMNGAEFVDYMTEYANNHPADKDKIMGLMGLNGVYYNTDWQSLIYRTAFSTDHNISIYGNGAKEKMPYRVSMGANYDQGTVRGGDNTRVNVGFNLSPKFLKEHLTANINVKGIWNKSNWTNNAVYAALMYDPTKPAKGVYGPDGNLVTPDNSNIQWFNGYINWTDLSATDGNPNPLSSLYDNVNYGKSLRSIGNLQLDYKVHGLEDLRFNLNLGYDIAQARNFQYNQIGSLASFKSTEDVYNEYTGYNANTLLDFYANYNKEFGKHHLDVMAGYSWQHNYFKDRTLGFLNDNRKVYSTGSSTEESRLFHPREYYLISFFGRLNYSIDSRYLFTFTVREDATSRFAKNNRWGFFPSAAFAWNIAQEHFLRDSDALSALKLRLGWGRTGQQDIGSNYYPHIPLYTSSNNGHTQYMDGIEGTLAPAAYNRNIKWETTETYNAGIDFGFVNGRINGSVDYYFRNTYDLLSEVDVPTGSNFTNRMMSNIGSMHNKGVEVALNFIPVQTTDWNWTISLNGTWQQTRIANLNGNTIYVGAGLSGTGGSSSIHREGYEPFTFLSFQQVYDANGRPIQNTFVDRNGDGRIDEDDKYITGKSATPDFFYGVSMSLSYKNWDFGFNGHGTVGNYAINSIACGRDNNTTYISSLPYYYIRNINEYQLRTGFTELSTERQSYSDMFIENASFFRLDDVNLGYTFRNIRHSDINLRIAASVQNVFVITKFTGLDPEVNSADGVYGTIIPRPRLYTLRLNVNF